MTEHWLTEMKAEHAAMKSNIKLRAWSDLIMQLFSKREQDELLEILQDRTKDITFQMAVSVKDR